MSTTEGARLALAKRNETPAQRTIHDLIERQKPELERALGSAVGMERFARIVSTELRRTPKLYECSAESLLGAIMLAAQLDLEPGPLGWSHLVPYREQGTTVCQFIVGYRGMVELAHRSGAVAGVRAALVYDGDEWEPITDTPRGPKFRHVPCNPEARGELLGGYCAWLERLGPRVLVPQAHWCWPQDFETARKRSPAGRKNVGPWQTDLDAMRLKTCVRRASSLMPQSPGYARALEVDEHPAVWQGGEVVTEEASDDPA